MTPWEADDWFLFLVIVAAGLIVVGPVLTVGAVLVWGVLKAIRTSGMEGERDE